MKRFLIELLGAGNVIDGDAELETYAEDFTEIEPCPPKLVAFVRTTEQVQAIVKRASRDGVPLIPRVAGSNVGGLTIPVPDSVVLDMTHMNRVLEINPDEMYAVIEPGVTQQGLKDAIAQKGYPLTLGYSLAPPYTSVLVNALLIGLTNRSLKYGDQASWLSGLEVVTADGSLLRTGAWALSDVPFGRVPFPDLTGLYVGWQGTTGVVTRGVFQLWPAHPLNKRLMIPTYGPRGTFDAMQRLCRKEICDDIGGISWPAAKMMLGVERPNPVPQPGEPQFMLYVDLTAEIPEEMAVKEKILAGVLESVRREGHAIDTPMDIRTLVKVNRELGAFAEFPVDLKFLTAHSGGGLTWIGTYGPVSRFAECAEAAGDVMTRAGVPPLIVSRPMRGGHYGVLRFITTFDKKDPGEVQRVRTLNREVLELVTERGFVMYKTPVWAWKALEGRLDPGMLRMMRRLKEVLDPAGIFNPGKLGL